MKCQKCAYDFGELQAKYCPNCGKKILYEITNDGLRNVDAWGYLKIEDFSKEWEKVKTLNAEDAFVWLSLGRDPIKVYTIEVLEYITLDKKKTRRVAKRSVDDIYYDLSHGCREYYIEMNPREAALKRTYNPEHCGKSWWWTKEECLAAIHDVEEKAKRRISMD